MSIRTSDRLSAAASVPTARFHAGRLRRGLSVLAAATALASGSGAFAAHSVIYGPRSDAFANSQTHQGPNVIGSTAWFVNGTAVAGNNFAGNAGTTSGGGSLGTTFAATVQNGGAGSAVLRNEAFAQASLADGTLKASTLSSGPNNFGTPGGIAQARIDDTIYFTNTTGGDLRVSFTYSFDGVLNDPFDGGSGDSNPGGMLSLQLSCDFFLCFNGAPGNDRPIRFAESGAVASSNMNYYFNEDTPSYFAENIFGGTNANFVTGLGPTHGVNGRIDGFITANLLIPTGTTSLGLRGTMNLDCRGGSSCDFGNTGRFRFGDLPEGLRIGSASGLFLSNVGAAIPEPASWAMMIAGFALTGAAARSRRRMLHLA